MMEEQAPPEVLGASGKKAELHSKKYICQEEGGKKKGGSATKNGRREVANIFEQLLNKRNTIVVYVTIL